MTIAICGHCGSKTKNGGCLNLRCQSNRNIDTTCEVLSKGWAIQEPTTKQLEFYQIKLRELQALGGNDHSSDAYHCKHCLSVHIENILAGIRYYKRKEQT